jgi:peptidoglycan hydrolase-like protein with peptidoglycan-binding domain
MDGLSYLGAEVIPWMTTNPKTGESSYVFLSAVGDAVTTIPTAGANYTDAKTVAAVQSALVAKGYDLGTSGPNNDGVDGMFGSKTKAAIKQMQADVGMGQSGIIDEGVISTLKVTPGVLPPGVSIQGRAALQAQVALDAATLAEHAETPGEVSAAADSVEQASAAAAPPLPPEIEQQAMAAVRKAKTAKTPAEAKAAAVEVKKAAEAVHSNVKPSWWVEPTWAGGPARWRTVAAGGAAMAAAGALAILLKRRG